MWDFFPLPSFFTTLNFLICLNWTQQGKPESIYRMSSQNLLPLMLLKIQRKLVDGSHHLFMEFICLIKTHGLPVGALLLSLKWSIRTFCGLHKNNWFFQLHWGNCNVTFKTSKVFSSTALTHLLFKPKVSSVFQGFSMKSWRNWKLIFRVF